MRRAVRVGFDTDGQRPVAVVTGASSGIGAATARRLAIEGFDVVVGARRIDRLREVASQIEADLETSSPGWWVDRQADQQVDHAVDRQADQQVDHAIDQTVDQTAGLRVGAVTAIELDVTSAESVEAFCTQVPACHVLVNNAGGALGFEPVAEADDAKWLAMFESNVLGTVRMIRALVPTLLASGDGRIVNVGSVAAHEPYPGGGGYNAAKFGVRALTRVLRMELLGEPIRITQIDPGMVETEFSIVRFDGDAARAAKVYDGVQPLTADDVADCIAWAVTRPPHVDIDEIVVRPRQQASVFHLHRERD